MKLVSYTVKKKDRLGIFYDEKIFDLQECASRLGIELPPRIRRFLRGIQPIRPCNIFRRSIFAAVVVRSQSSHPWPSPLCG